MVFNATFNNISVI